MANEKPEFKPVLRLQIVISMVVADTPTGEDCYRDLKVSLSLAWPGISISGNIVKMLEPCCGPKPQNPLSTGVANAPPR
jgi:hypothetical protein